MTLPPVIGIVGNDVPRQVVSAAGAVADRLTGGWAGPIAAEAADHLGGVDPAAARILTGLMDGQAVSDLAGIVVSNDSQAHLRLFYVLRMLRRTGLPPVHLLDLPRQEDPATRQFAHRQFRRLVDFCAAVTGTTPDAADWRRAADEERAVGRALDRLRERRRSHPAAVTGTAALSALLAAASAPPAEAVAALDAASGAAAPDALRVHVTGSGHPDATVYAMLERSGDVVVVGEDHDTGDLSWVGVAAAGEDADAVSAALVDAHFARATGSAVSTIAERARTCRDLVDAAGADAVLALVRRGDEAPLWDLAADAAAVAPLGVPMVRRVGLDAADLEAVIADAVDELRMREGVRA